MNKLNRDFRSSGIWFAARRDKLTRFQIPIARKLFGSYKLRWNFQRVGYASFEIRIIKTKSLNFRQSLSVRPFRTVYACIGYYIPLVYRRGTVTRFENIVDIFFKGFIRKKKWKYYIIKTYTRLLQDIMCYFRID